MEIRLRIPTVLFLLFLAAIVPGCGDDDTPPPAAPTGPPGIVEAIVKDANSIPARLLEVRLLAEPKPEFVPGGEGGAGFINTEPARPSVEGANMALVKKTQTDDYGKFRLTDVPPGRYLLSAGVPQTGIWREWIDVAPGATVSPTIKLPRR